MNKIEHKTLRVGSLFSGIGGLDLGLERAGMKIVWQVEIDDYCRRVLAKHWPDVRRHDDVRTFPPDPVDEWKCDLICGGFPCQDISNAGKRAGIEGARSGLWSEFARIVRVLRPRYVLVENVAALLGRGAGRVLGDLAECGYDAEWSLFSACALGAPHARERMFIVAHAERRGLAADWMEASRTNGDYGKRPAHWRERRLFKSPGLIGGSLVVADEAIKAASAWEDAPCEPLLLGIPDGVSKRVHRLKAIGNSVVPQVAQWIGERIMESIS